MSERLTNILGYLTLFAIMGAIWVMFGEDPTRDQGARGERTFDGLEERINEVAQLKISKQDRSATIVRDGDGWRMQERGGYKVDGDKVRAALRGMALSERREPKTDNKDRFERLGLGDDALQIELRDDTGGLILEFDMGWRKDTPSGRSLTYVWQATDTRSWLVTELADTEADPGWWLERPVLDIDMKRVSDVTIGGAWLTRKMGDSDFRLQGIRQDEKAAGSWALADPARVITALDFEDVRALANPLLDAVSVIELTTYDGLKIEVSLYEMDGGVWARVVPTFDAALQAEGEAGVLPAAPADGAAEAEALAAALRGWLFKLSDYDAGILTRTRADFTSVVDTPAAQ